MGRFLTAFTLFMALATANAENITPDYYAYPLEGVEQLYAGNVGEMRGGHFHAGVDIKSDGVEGKRVVAAADGYISRVGLSSGGYGKVIYITHPNNTTTVYGHLSQYRDDIEKYVTRERARTRQHSINLYFKSGQFPVKRGEFIALSGNTGSSGGPHLHYEVRKNETQSPINIFRRGIIKPRDTQPPLLFTLHYIEIDSIGGVAYASPINSYKIVRDSNNLHTLDAPNNTIEVGRMGHFIVECSDRKDGVTNTFGIYSLRGYRNSEPFFAYQNDGFTFKDSPYCKGVAYQPIKFDSRNEVVRMSISENHAKSFYYDTPNRGIIGCDQGESESIKIEIEDDCALKSTLTFNITGNASPFEATPVEAENMVFASKDFSFNSDSLRVNVPRGTLYDSTPFAASIAETPKAKEADSIKFLSPCIRVFSKEIALHKKMEVSLKCDIEPHLKEKVTIAMVSKKGDVYGINSEYRDGWVTAKSGNTGEFIVAIDDQAPKVIPNFSNGFNMGSHKFMSFKVSDNLSGIKDYECHIDDEWVPLDLEHGVLKHYFYHKPTQSRHQLKLTVDDNCGNKTTIEREFIR